MRLTSTIKDVIIKEPSINTYLTHPSTLRIPTKNFNWSIFLLKLKTSPVLDLTNPALRKLLGCLEGVRIENGRWDGLHLKAGVVNI